MVMAPDRRVGLCAARVVAGSGPVSHLSLVSGLWSLKQQHQLHVTSSISSRSEATEAEHALAATLDLVRQQLH
jgi:hypothetical protein